MSERNSIWVGFDTREAAAYAVARHSAKRHMSRDIPIHGLVLSDLQAKGLYTRPLEFRASAADKPVMWDVISDAAMSTQHACARFLISELAREGWAMFCDGDVLFRDDVAKVFDALDPRYALYCVKHNYTAKPGIKMDGMPQTVYPKKNWSSVFVVNTQHEANRALTAELVNTVPGRDLHRFAWLDESDIGTLPPEWNYLVGESPRVENPSLAHFTLGPPDMDGYEHCEFADEWRAELARWAA